MIRVHQITTRLRSLSDFLGKITLRSSTFLIGGGVGNRTVVIHRLAAAVPISAGPRTRIIDGCR
jgi:hypothetical protein